MTRHLPTIVVLLMLASGCSSSSGDDRPPTPSETDASDVGMWVELSGDLESILRLQPEPGAIAEGADAVSLREAWAAGHLEPPPVRFSDGSDLVGLSWPRWDAGRDPSDLTLRLRLDGYTVVAGPEACRAEVAPVEEFVLRGSLVCEGLSGVKPGGATRPMFDLVAEFTYRIYACVTTAQADGGTFCAPIDD